MHIALRLDPVVGFFLMVIGAIAVLVGIYALGGRTSDERRSSRTAASTACLILLASLVAYTADDVLMFIFAWKLLALARCGFGRGRGVKSWKCGALCDLRTVVDWIWRKVWHDAHVRVVALRVSGGS